MSTPDPIDAYLKELRRRLRWRRGRRRIAEEVEDHLRELAAAERAKGASGDDAARLAIERVGDPAALVPRRTHNRALAAAAGCGVAGVIALALFAFHASQPAARDALPARLIAREIAAVRLQNDEFDRTATLAGAVTFAGFPLYRPEDALGSDATVEAVWESHPAGPQVTILYKSALLVTIQRWNPRGGRPAAGMRALAGVFRHTHTRFAWIDGSPAAEVASGPPIPILGYGTPLDQFGEPATVWLVKRGVFVIIQRWGPRTLPGVIAAARSLQAAAVSGAASGA